SWNFTKRRVNVDVHWGLRDVPATDWLDEQMWASGERLEFSGRKLLLQSPEFAFLSTLNHGFLWGGPGYPLQTVIDAVWCLPHCQADRLDLLLNRSQLLEPFHDLVSIFDRIGLTETVSSASRKCSRSLKAVHEERNRAITLKLPRRRSVFSKTESHLLRRPAIYQLWTFFGRKARIEPVLLWLTGPFSKPLEHSRCRTDYDFRDCSVMDALGGPGWRWPEPDHSGFWSDRPDARLLIPLRRVGDHLVVLE